MGLTVDNQRTDGQSDTEDHGAAVVLAARVQQQPRQDAVLLICSGALWDTCSGRTAAQGGWHP